MRDIIHQTSLHCFATMNHISTGVSRQTDGLNNHLLYITHSIIIAIKINLG